ncbi:MAG TPA: [Fe-S]-binding protein, partial [Rhodocyclaceae bacterium]
MTKCLTCTCNASIPAGAFTAAGAQPVRALCRGDVEQFRAASHQGGPLLVGCTQEAAFFEELANREDSPAELRFVNLREYAGWSAEGAQSGPKIAALLAMAAMPAPAPIASIDLESQGSLLIIGPAAVALDWATRLKDELDVAVLATEGAKLPSRRDFPLWDGRGVSVKGHLGAFEVSWRNASPIDLELCTGCG